MRHILITAFLLPVAAFSQHHIRVLHPAEMCPEESYAFFRASPLVIAALLCAANDLLNKHLGNRP